jgi:hypothetical protein
MPATLDVSPSWVKSNRTSTVTFIGVGTSWLSGAPTFTPSVVAGVSCGAVTVISDTLARAPVTYGTNVGVITWTDSTTAATIRQRVSQAGRPKWVGSGYG